jgi:hypothetical protein
MFDSSLESAYARKYQALQTNLAACDGKKKMKVTVAFAKSSGDFIQVN